ncbi:MAG: hypothetical protein NVSMB19_24610 [Vulcanimicrobiaceae bacterium]
MLNASEGSRVRAAIDTRAIGERVWFYTNYHCNLACRYCLTSSSPAAPKRELDAATLLAIADDAVRLGFGSFGITGGEPFLRRDMPDVVAALAARLPVVVLTNGTLFTERVVAERLAPLARLPVELQISIDAADAARNDRYRGAGSHARAVAALERLHAYGIGRRIGTTVADDDAPELAALAAFARTNGVRDENQVVRPMIARGAAVAAGLGDAAEAADVPPELTITVDGAFWSPASPTIVDGQLDIGERLTRTIRPLDGAADAMVRYAAALPPRTHRVT